MPKKQPLLIAHRGDTVNFTENTLEAFSSAFKHGADGIELDIHLHHGEIIIVHHHTFDLDKTYPKLSEVFEQFRGKGRIEIEVKDYHAEILAPLTKLVQQMPDLDLEFTSSEIPLIPHLTQRFSKYPVGIIIQEGWYKEWMSETVVKERLVNWAKLSNANCLHLSNNVIELNGEANLIEYLHHHQIIVHSHVFHKPDQDEVVAKLTKWGIDQMTIDDINLIKSLRQ